MKLSKIANLVMIVSLKKSAKYIMRVGSSAAAVCLMYQAPSEVPSSATAARIAVVVADAAVDDLC